MRAAIYFTEPDGARFRWEALLQEETRKRWLDLCAEAAICEDPERLQQLAYTINAVLTEEKRRLETSQMQRFRTAS